MRKFSLKRQKENREYSKLRVAYLQEHPMCEARVSTDCTGISTTIHHRKGRSGNNLTIVENFLGCCMPCHEAIERNPRRAKELGLSESRLAK